MKKYLFILCIFLVCSVSLMASDLQLKYKESQQMGSSQSIPFFSNYYMEKERKAIEEEQKSIKSVKDGLFSGQPQTDYIDLSKDMFTQPLQISNNTNEKATKEIPFYYILILLVPVIFILLIRKVKNGKNHSSRSV